MQDLLQLQGGFCGFCVPPRGNGWKHIPVAVATQQTLAAWASSGISWQEVASSALCKPRGTGWGFWQVEMRKVMQCHQQLFSLLMAQTFLKGLSRSWRSSKLPSCGRWVVIWAVCLPLRMSCVFLHTPTSTHPTLSFGYKSQLFMTEATQRRNHEGNWTLFSAHHLLVSSTRGSLSSGHCSPASKWQSAG